MFTDTLLIVLQTCLLSGEVYPQQGVIEIRKDSVIVSHPRYQVRAKRVQDGGTYYLNSGKSLGFAFHAAGHISLLGRDEYDALELWNVHSLKK